MAAHKRQSRVNGVVHPSPEPAPQPVVVPADPYQFQDPYATAGTAEVPSDVDVVLFGQSDLDATQDYPARPQPEPEPEPEWEYPLAPGSDPVWVGRTRGFARGGVWALPAAAVALAVAALWGVPGPAHPPTGASPGSWLVLTASGLALTLVGALSLTVLLVPTPGRGWAFGGLVLAIAGTVAVSATLGVIGLARPAAGRLGASAAHAFEADLRGGPVLRWLGVGGLAVLAAGWILLAVAVIGSRVFNRVDGLLILATIAIALLAVPLPPLLGLAMLSLLAAGLGLAWSAVRPPARAVG